MNANEHKIIVVTPAGREKYLSILSRYIIADESIDEWHLWDNCRQESDRQFLKSLQESHQKIKIIQISDTDGTNKSINRFWKFAKDLNTFYIRIDDDVVWLPHNFGQSLYNAALAEKNDFLYWSPLVVNNSICTYILKHSGKINTNAEITAQALCPVAWKSPVFSEKLHLEFINSLRAGCDNDWKTNTNHTISLSRFSINCLGFFGDMNNKLGDIFCPQGVDEEEYVSATLPLITNKPGRIIGSIVVSHFSFYPQEDHLLSTKVLNGYADIAGIKAFSYNYIKRKSFLDHLIRLAKYNYHYVLENILCFNKSANYHVKVAGQQELSL